MTDEKLINTKESEQQFDFKRKNRKLGVGLEKLIQEYEKKEQSTIIKTIGIN